MTMKLGSLQTRIVLSLGLVIVVVQLIAVVLLQSVGTENFTAQVNEELVTGERMFNQIVQQRTTQLAQAARVLTADYAFREALASHDDATISSALVNHGARINARVMVLVGLDRRVVADIVHPESAGFPFSVPQLIAVAEKSGQAASIVALDRQLYQVVVLPVAAPLPLGWVVLGFPIDRAAVMDLERVTNLDVTFFDRSDRGWSVVASTLPSALQSAAEEQMRTGRVPQVGMTTLGNADYATRLSDEGLAGSDPVVAMLQIPMDRARLPFQRLLRQFVLLGLVGVLIAMISSVLIARGIAHPLREIAAFARRIAAGDYSARSEIERKDEIGDLSAAFKHMQSSIESREQEIMKLAYRDALTGLPNRALFNERLQQAILSARRSHQPMAILIMDLDRFKDVNDTLGHHLGDQLLSRFAERLTAGMRRETDTVARLGGDEFAVLLPASDGDAAARIARALLRSAESPMTLDGHVVDIHASVGIACYPEHGDDAAGLVQRADVAMYLAKRNNTGLAIYDNRYDQHSAERLSLMGELRQAVEENQLVVYYQPKVSLIDPSKRFVEALIRWQHPTRGFVPPSEFIPFAEQTGYIRRITMWVLDHVTSQVAQWRREGFSVQVAVNISTRDLLNPEMPAAYAAMLTRYDCPADAIWMEITESAILEDTTHAIANLEKLAALGCRLSIDDYGTGYSSLSYLKRLPVSELKIDGSFVANMLTDRDDGVIVQSTIELAHNMGLTVTAEGVEDQATFDQLRTMGCDMAQGFLMCPPLPTDELRSWMEDSRWVAAGPVVPVVRLVG